MQLGVEVLTVPAVALVEFLAHGAAQGFAAHVHGNKAGGKKGAVAVAVYFFKNESEYRCVDHVAVVGLDAGAGVAAEVVGIEESEEVVEGVEGSAAAFAAAVEQHGVGRQGHFEPVFEGREAQGAAFEFGLFEERAVEVGYAGVFFEHGVAALVFGHGEHMEKKFVEFVEVAHLVGVEQAGGVGVAGPAQELSVSILVYVT